MSGSSYDWQNQACSFYDCEDRQYQKKLYHQLQDNEKRLNELYKSNREIKNTLVNRDKAVREILGDMLSKNDTLSDADIDKIREKVSKAIDNEKLSNIAKRNLSLQERNQELMIELDDTRKKLDFYRTENDKLKKDKTEREERDRRELERQSDIPHKMQDLLKRKEDLEIEVSQYAQRRDQIQEEITVGRDEARQIAERLRVDGEALDNYQKRLSVLRKEYQAYDKVFRRRTKKARQLMDKCLRLHSKGRTERAMVAKVRAETAYKALSGHERDVLKPKYDEMVKVLGDGH